MRQDFFAIPIFQDVVDLSKIILLDKELKPTFRSGIQSSFLTEREVKKETTDYLTNLIRHHISDFISTYTSIVIKEIWRNIYEENDYQDPHIHSNSQWSFIIYENVKKSNTVFLNPNRHLIETSMRGYDATINGYYLDTNFMNDFKPNYKTGDIVIFPSFLEHFVLAGGKGSTISGNIICS